MSYLPEAQGSFFVSAEEARGQVEDNIECGKVTVREGNSQVCVTYLIEVSLLIEK